MRKIFCICGKSATGKDTIYQELLKAVPELTPVICHTTRPMYDGESNGINYHYVDGKQMTSMLDNNEIIECRSYTVTDGVWNYFTSTSELEDETKHYLLINTIAGIRNIQKHFENRAIVIPIYLEVEDGCRLQRALQREREKCKPQYSEVCRRFLADESDFSEEKLQECESLVRFSNFNLKTCLSDIQNCVLKILND